MLRGTEAESDRMGALGGKKVPSSAQEKALNMERVRAHQVAGNAPWEMQSLCPKQCVSRECREERNEERQREGGVCHER